jgi:O-antigen ligase
MKNYRFNANALKSSKLLVIIVFIGFISGLLNIGNYDIYFQIRDFLYFIQAPIYITLGIFLYEEIKNNKIFIQLLVLSSLTVTIYLLIPLIMDSSLIYKIGLEARYEYHFSNTLATFTSIVIIYARKVKYKLFNNSLELLFLFISLFSLAISFSRINYLIMFILLLIPYLYNKTYLIKKIFLSICFFITFFIFGGQYFQDYKGGNQGNDFETKVLNSLSEIVITDYTNITSINQNWRGYEANLGLLKFYNGSIPEYFFGQGYGTVVYTPTWVFKNSLVDNLDILPIFHNGYITILLKTGFLGLLLFFAWLYFLLVRTLKMINYENTKEEKLNILFIQGIVYLILLQTFVIHGIFQTKPPFILLLLLGYILQNYYVEKNYIKKVNHE